MLIIHIILVKYKKLIKQAIACFFLNKNIFNDKMIVVIK